MTEGHDTSEPVVVGRVIKPTGLLGEVQIQVLTDSPDRYAIGGVLFLDGVQRRIHRVSTMHKGKINLKLDGIDDRHQADKLRDAMLTVTPDMVPEPPEGYYYHYQIVDMEVFTEEGEYLGRIADILVTGSNDVYVVRGDNGEVLIPALDDVILEVDVEKRRMMVSLPEGLR